MTKADPTTRASARIGTLCWIWLALLAALLPATHCGPLDEGDSELARIRRLPDPLEFGARVHPALVSSCAAAACHGRERTLTLHDVEPLPMDAQVDHPLDLPDAIRADYYLVLAFCDLEIPETSQLIRWGTGAEPAHPGGDAMSAETEALLLGWLRSGGSP